MIVIKRDGSEVEFDKNKIREAILKAMKFGSGIIKEGIAENIADEIEAECIELDEVSIQDIEKAVFEKLIAKRQKLTARAYEGYRAVRENQRKQGTIDDKVIALIKGNHENQKDNSNKDTNLISTMRDLVAEEVSKDIALRMMLPPHIAQAHNDGLIYIHDLGHYLNPSFNCFSYDTRFVTNKGVRSFSECFDGEKIKVVDMYGQWQEAIVRKYNKKPLQKVTVQSGRSSTTIRCTRDHRWILKDGTVTTDLKVGDVLWTLPDIQKRPLYKNPEMFVLGMILGDGHDVIKGNSKGMSIRLCKDKVKYKNVFEECGYKVVYIYENGDIVLSKFGKALKKNFIENKVWEFLNTDDVIDVFNGYYCADGSVDRNMLSTADYNLLEFIKYASGMSGFYISSIKVNNKPTNFSDNRTLFEVRFRKHTTNQNNWKVTSIDRSDGTPRETWCVEQPVNKSFTLENGVVTGNCCLINLEDMLQNGTVINGKMITKPHSFRTACTIATQIIAQVASGQFGGQTISLAHLAPFVRISKDRITREVEKEVHLMSAHLGGDSEEDYRTAVDRIVAQRLAKEITDGVQTFQYQINTLQTANGQAPFLSVFMYINEDPEYREETVMLTAEFLRQRIKGMQNEVGAWITPAFPKLLYITDENNIHEDSKYFWLTKLAAECVTKRMMPDFISAKHMRQNYEGNVFGCMGCRAWLSPYTGPINNTEGEYKWYGRFNMGLTSINLADVGLSAEGDLDKFWDILNERLQLCFESLMLRYEKLKDVTSDVSPIHWQHGAIARLDKHEPIYPLLQDGYATISLGYIGIYECVKALIGQSHTTPEGEELALKIMKHLKATVTSWKQETGLGFALYGTPSESLTDRFARLTRARWGVIEGITDRDYLTNSYHVFVQEEIDAFSKLKFEAQFHPISSGGAISYIEMPNMKDNVEAVLATIQFMYDNVQYAEFNTKLDYCMVCGYEGEILCDDNLEWYCPNCGNRDKDKMNVCRRTCGYLGENFWNEGRTEEIKDRVMHLDNKEVCGDCR